MEPTLMRRMIRSSDFAWCGLERPQACPEMTKKRVVIIGGGFGGLTAARALHRDDVVLIDRTNHHVFQPLLYQVATAALSPSDIAWPLRTVFRSQRNVAVVMEEVIAIDRAVRSI